MSGCTKTGNSHQGASKLVIVSITGTDLEGAVDSNIIYSDVITTSGSIYDDHLIAVCRVYPLYPYQLTTTLSWYQDIVVDQIDVEFTRADGLNRQGIDVPYAFSQQVFERVSMAGASEIDFVIVSHNAKSESPLIELAAGGQEHTLKLEARITFHSKDLAGNRLEPVVSGLSVWCSNFADNK
jgi:hypothetical protein